MSVECTSEERFVSVVHLHDGPVPILRLEARRIEVR